MVLLRKYQLDIIFLFFALAVILWSFFTLLQYYGADPRSYQIFVATPLLVLYGVILIKIRLNIKKQERRALSGKTICYWIALGVLLFASYAAPLPATNYWSVEIAFILFTIFLADSYWDFRQLAWRKLFSKKELS